MRSLRRDWVVVGMVLCLSIGVRADVRLPAIFSDNMVVQQQADIAVWGWADAGEKVVVKGSWGKETSTTANADGKWILKLSTPKAGDAPLTLTVEGKNRIVLNNVLSGEVWLCSGQSNMAFPVRGAMNAEDEAKDADQYPKIRNFGVQPKASALMPQEDCSGEWQVCSTKTVPGFSATAYFFGREMHKTLKIPVGLINSSWGGTPIESWLSLDVQQDDLEVQANRKRLDAEAANYDSAKSKAQYEAALRKWQQEKAKAGDQPFKKRRPRPRAHPHSSQRYPGSLYNGMIEPVSPYTIRGAIWYQGEANSHSFADAVNYRFQLARLATSWRAAWTQRGKQEADFPFYAVQLPSFREPQTQPVETEQRWPVIRESFLHYARNVENAGIAVTIDVGEANNIHPKNKQAVGKRLAMLALNKTYGKDVVPSGPLYKSSSIQGNQVIIEFDYVGEGLQCRGDALKGFAIAGADRKFAWSDARIEGDRVIVSADGIAKPTAVRYAWADNPECNLYNKAGLPASPFRTDDWPLE